MTTRQLRLLRATSASAVATLIAAVSHTIGGGAAPHPLLVAALTVFLVPVSAALIGARPSRVRVSATVLVAQGVFHVVFQLLGGPTAAAAGAARAHEHHHALADLGPLETAAAPAAWMLGAHLAAALVTTLLLWHGERMLRGIACWVLAVLRRAACLARPEHAHPAALRSLAHAIADARLVAGMSRRGPPVSSCGLAALV